MWKCEYTMKEEATFISDHKQANTKCKNSNM